MPHDPILSFYTFRSMATRIVAGCNFCLKNNTWWISFVYVAQRLGEQRYIGVLLCLCVNVSFCFALCTYWMSFLQHGWFIYLYLETIIMIPSIHWLCLRAIWYHGLDLLKLWIIIHWKCIKIFWVKAFAKHCLLMYAYDLVHVESERSSQCVYLFNEPLGKFSVVCQKA